MGSYFVGVEIGHRADAKIEKLGLELDAERATIKTFSVKMIVTMSGNWKQSPTAIQLMSPVDTEFYLSFTDDDLPDRNSKQHAVGSFEFADLAGSNRVAFTANVGPHPGDFPLGSSIEEFASIKNLTFYIPFTDFGGLEGTSTNIKSVEVRFFINGLPHGVLKSVSSFKVPLKHHNNNRTTRWAVFNINLSKDEVRSLILDRKTVDLGVIPN